MKRSISDTAQRARKAYEDTMLDTCRIERATDPSLDLDTLVLEAGTPTVVYEGCSSLSYLTDIERENSRADTTLTTSAYVLKLPVATVDVRINDRVIITSNLLGEVLDDIPFRVAEILPSKWQVVRRLYIEKVEDRG